MGKDLVSVIIPCYNHARFLGEAIESVLSQTCQHFEIIVIDDGSTDNTSEIALRYPGVRCLRQGNMGQAAARNRGLQESKGDYVVFLDADDRLMPNALEAGLEKLSGFPECAFVYGHYRPISRDGLPLTGQRHRAVEKEQYCEMLKSEFIGMPATVMYRKSVLMSVGGFNPSLNIKGREDSELYLRITKSYRICSHDAVVAEYRQHGENISHNFALMLKAGMIVFRMQRKHVKGNREYEEAYKIGINNQKILHGGNLLREFDAHMKEHRWKDATKNLRELMHYYPKGLVRHISPKWLFHWYAVLARFLVRVRLSIKPVDAHSSPHVYEGYHDGADCKIINGWVWDAKHPERSVYVDIFDNGTLLATVQSNEYREDLTAAGKGNGNYAFHYPVPPCLKDGRAHVIEVRITGTDLKLGETPKEIRCKQ